MKCVGNNSLKLLQYLFLYMVSEEPLSIEQTIQISIMTPVSCQNPIFIFDTQPPFATGITLIALNITAQINEKFEALLIGYDLLCYVEGTFRCPSSTADEFHIFFYHPPPLRQKPLMKLGKS